MEQENHHCYGCKAYQPYYTKGYSSFDRQDIGYCRKKKETVRKHEICEFYSGAYYPSTHKDSLEMKIDDTIKVFSELKQIVAEGFEDVRVYEAEVKARREEILNKMKQCPYSKNGECPARRKKS